MKNQIELIPTSSSNIFQVRLNLPCEQRYIAKYDITSEGTITIKRKESHIFKKLNALGVNHELLKSDSIPFKWITIDLCNSSSQLLRKLVTSRAYFLKHGQCYKFNSQGFELQCFLPIEKFGIDKARLYEAEQVVQQSFFGEVM